MPKDGWHRVDKRPARPGERHKWHARPPERRGLAGAAVRKGAGGRREILVGDRWVPEDEALAMTREPTDRQREAWEAVHRLGTQVAAARALDVSQGAIQSLLRGYMAAAGLDGPLPGYLDGKVRRSKAPSGPKPERTIERRPMQEPVEPERVRPAPTAEPPRATPAPSGRSTPDDAADLHAAETWDRLATATSEARASSRFDPGDRDRRGGFPDVAIGRRTRPVEDGEDLARLARTSAVGPEGSAQGDIAVRLDVRIPLTVVATWEAERLQALIRGLALVRAAIEGPR